MKNVGDRAVLIGAVLIGLIIAAITWFVAIGPKLNSASEARDQAEAQSSQNDVLQMNLNVLMEKKEHLPDYLREIENIRDLLPQTENVPDNRRLFDQIAKNHGLTISVDVVSNAELVLGGVSLAAAMEQVGLTSEIEGMTFTTLTATQYNISFKDPVLSVVDFIEELQATDGQYFLVNSFSENPTTSATVEITIGVVVFTLDYGDSTVHLRSPERPWPGTEETDPPPAVPPGGGDAFIPFLESEGV